MADTPDTLPTKEELAELPVRAIVAYAARCARRVQPLYNVHLARNLPDEVLKKSCQAIDRAVTLAERWARNESVSIADLKAAADAFVNYAFIVGAAAAHAAADAANAADAGARRDFDILKAHRFKPDDRVNASESGVCGELWIDQPPDWYIEGLEQLRQLGVLKKPSRRKSSTPAANTKELQQLRAEHDRLQREQRSLEANLETARTEANDLRRMFENAEEIARQSAKASALTEYHAAQLEISLRKKESELLHAQTQLEIARIGEIEAKDELELRKPQNLSWYGRMFFRAENILNSITVAVLCAIVGIALVGIGQVYERQALDRWVKARSDEFQDRALRASRVDGNAVTERNTFEAFHSRIMILSIAGATTREDTIAGLREQLRKVQVETTGAAFPPLPAQGPDSWWRSLISWPEYRSSDFLLSLVVLFSASIGAVITTMRRNDRLSFRELGLGVSAGFITFLVVRGGKSVFLVDADPMPQINPYNSAFFGMLAGMFTELTFGMLGLFAKEFSERVKRVVKLVFSEPLPTDDKQPKPDPPADEVKAVPVATEPVTTKTT